MNHAPRSEDIAETHTDVITLLDYYRGDHAYRFNTSDLTYQPIKTKDCPPGSDCGFARALGRGSQRHIVALYVKDDALFFATKNAIIALEDGDLTALCDWVGWITGRFRLMRNGRHLYEATWVDPFRETAEDFDAPFYPMIQGVLSSDHNRTGYKRLWPLTHSGS